MAQIEVGSERPPAAVLVEAYEGALVEAAKHYRDCCAAIPTDGERPTNEQRQAVVEGYGRLSEAKTLYELARYLIPRGWQPLHPGHLMAKVGLFSPFVTLIDPTDGELHHYLDALRIQQLRDCQQIPRLCRNCGLPAQTKEEAGGGRVWDTHCRECAAPLY